MIMQERKKYLSMHTQKQWQSTNGRYMTYLYTDGKRKLISKPTQEALEECIVQHYKRITNDPTVKSIFNEWINNKLEYGEIERQTYDKYITVFDRCMDDMKDKYISDITESVLEDKIKRTIHDKELSYKAWSDWRIVINGIFHYSHKRKFTSLNIRDFMDDLQLSPKIFKQKIRLDEENVFTNEEVDKVLDHIYTDKITRTDLGIILAFQTGLRAGEIVCLTKNDVDFEKKILTVNKTETHYKINGKTVYKICNHTKGRDGHRIIYLSDGAVKTLYILCNMSNDDKLFMTHAGAFTDRLYRICDKIKIPKRSVHKCRKTYATRLVNAGVPDILIQKMLGHTDRTVTYKHYVFNNRKEDEERELISFASNF